MTVVDPSAGAAARLHSLRQASIRLEAQFLSEMLKAAGFDAQVSGFSGGIGEEQFASFLRDAQAEEIAQSGALGLSEALFEALKARAGYED